MMRLPSTAPLLPPQSLHTLSTLLRGLAEWKHNGEKGRKGPGQLQGDLLTAKGLLEISAEGHHRTQRAKKPPDSAMGAPVEKPLAVQRRSWDGMSYRKKLFLTLPLWAGVHCTLLKAFWKSPSLPPPGPVKCGQNRTHDHLQSKVSLPLHARGYLQRGRRHGILWHRE